MTLTFDELAPPLNICFKNAVNHFLVNSSAKDSLEELKTWCSSYSAFWLTGQWGTIAPLAPGYATGHVIADPDFHRAGPLTLWRFSQHLSAKCR